MKVTKTGTTYVVELTDDESGLVLDDWYDGIGERLEKLPIYGVNYDGHFGPIIEFTVNVEDDTEELHEQVLATCRQRLSELDGTRLRGDLR